MLGTVALGDETCKQAVADAGSAAAVVAAMSRQPDDLEVQQQGCYALAAIAAGSDAGRQAVATAGGQQAAATAAEALEHNGQKSATHDLDARSRFRANASFSQSLRKLGVGLA